MRGTPHLHDTLQHAQLELDQPPPPPEHEDRIPHDLYTQWQIEMDAEIAADLATLAAAHTAAL
jgi:hypothetical protein